VPLRIGQDRDIPKTSFADRLQLLNLPPNRRTLGLLPGRDSPHPRRACGTRVICVGKAEYPLRTTSALRLPHSLGGPNPRLHRMGIILNVDPEILGACAWCLLADGANPGFPPTLQGALETPGCPHRASVVDAQTPLARTSPMTVSCSTPTPRPDLGRRGRGAPSCTSMSARIATASSARGTGQLLLAPDGLFDNSHVVHGALRFAWPPRWGERFSADASADDPT
jgi:hypothetical protein